MSEKQGEIELAQMESQQVENTDLQSEMYGTRIYSNPDKWELPSIYSQLVEDVSQSSCSQLSLQLSEDSVFSFCQKTSSNLPTNVNKNLFSLSHNTQFHKEYQSNYKQSSISIYITASNIAKPKKRGKQKVPNDEQPKVSVVGTLMTEPQTLQQSSNSIQSVMSTTGTMRTMGTMGSLMVESQILNNSIDLNYNTSSSDNDRIQSFSILLKGKPQFQRDDSHRKMETKYKKKDINREENDEDSGILQQSRGFEDRKTQVKQRNQAVNPYQGDPNDLEYFISTVKQGGGYEGQDEVEYVGKKINSSIIENEKTYGELRVLIESKANEERRSILKENIDENIFKNNIGSNLFLNKIDENIFKNNGCLQKKCSKLTSVARRCKRSGERQVPSSIFQTWNEQKSQPQQIQSQAKQIKRPFFMFDEDESESQTSDETHMNFDNIWNREYQVDNLHNIFIPFRRNDGEQREEIDFNGMFPKKTKNSTISRDKRTLYPALTTDYEKLRYTSSNTQRLKHYEFNCFRDRDLSIDQIYQNQLQDIQIDDDVQTDDETLELYVEVCFKDLIEAIDVEHDDNKDDSTAVHSQNNLDLLWECFSPPCYSELIQQ